MTTATNQLPTDVTRLPAGPNSIEINPLHLSITKKWDSGAEANIHLLENPELGLILKRGSADLQQMAIEKGRSGTLIISVGIDADHDEVHYDVDGSDDRVSTEELLSQAIETLLACRQAITNVHKSSS